MHVIYVIRESIEARTVVSHTHTYTVHSSILHMLQLMGCMLPKTKSLEEINDKHMVPIGTVSYANNTDTVSSVCLFSETNQII